MRLKLVTSVSVLFVSIVVAGQTPKFDVASVKPQTERGSSASQSGIRYYETSTALRRVIEFAYDRPAVRIIGGPAWIDTDRWSINARVSTPATTEEMRPMVRALLADRFRLVVHFEMRQLPVYDLSLARQDGRLGQNLKPAAGDCSPLGARSIDEFRAAGVKLCGPGNLRVGPGFARRRFVGVELSALARHLEGVTRRVVRDRTGITGPFDLELTYAVEAAGPPPPALFGPRQGEAPALFTALQEQLGLKLEAGTGPVDVLVIDSVQRPSPD